MGQIHLSGFGCVYQELAAAGTKF